MFIKKLAILFSISLLVHFTGSAQTSQRTDVCIYGASSAGVIAAYTAKKMGKNVVLVEPGIHLGGLTTGGLGYTDIGNKYAITGLSRDFYRKLGSHYGKLEQWIFEPHVAQNILQGYLDDAGIKVLYQHQLQSVKKTGTTINSIILKNAAKNGDNKNLTIEAAMFLDCTYEGDLMAKAGVSYTVGREANSLYNETYNGVQLREKHQFPDGIDPYKIPGKPESGLVWGISTESLATQGAGDKKVQAYNFRICLSNDPANMIEITKPEGYDSSKYELLLRYLEKKPAKDFWAYLKFDLMPNHKTDINNNGPFSTDMIGMNYDFAEASFEQRQQIQQAHETYIKGFLYFVGHDSRMPENLRQQILKWGYPKDEYINNNHWSPQMYVREARRMIGAYVMTQANCEGKEKVTDGVGMAAYTMDSHNCQRLVVNGMVKNEGDVQIGGFGPYPISYRCIIPKREECTNLLVPVCLSATHIAYGSIRMEPVFMVLGQSAAAAAVQAINKKQVLQDIDVKKLQQSFATNPLADNSTPEILVDNDEPVLVKKTGEWTTETKGCYGPSMFVHKGNSSLASVEFKPKVEKAGEYELYAYIPKHEGIAADIAVTVNKSPQSVNISNLQVEGQTSGEWVFLGKHKLAKGSTNSISVHAGKSQGLVIADAILCVPDFK